MCISSNINLYKTYIIMVIIKPPHCHQATQIHFEGSPLKGSGSELLPFGSVVGWFLSKNSAAKIKSFDIENLALLLWMLGCFFRVSFLQKHKDAKSGIIVRLEWGENPELKPEETFLILAI